MALVARALGFVVFVLFVRGQAGGGALSVADVCWLSMYVFLGIGLVRLSRRGVIDLPASILLDGVVAALSTTAIAVAVLHELPGTHAGIHGGLDDAVLLLFPALDVLLLLVVVGVFTTHRWRPPRTLWVLGAGVLGFAVTDAAYAYQAITGTFSPGSWLSASWSRPP